MDAAALAAVFDFPSLAQSRARVIALAESGNGSSAALTAALESDAALVLATLRAAYSAETGRSIASVADAIDVLPGDRIAAVARAVRPYDAFTNGSSGPLAPDAFLLHARGVQRLADELARETGHRGRDELLTVAVLHDVGKLVLASASPVYARWLQVGNGTPEERASAERSEFGECHADAGARALEALGLPASLARDVETHHSPAATEGAALVRLADMLMHYRAGRRIDFDELTTAAGTVGLDRDRLGALIYELTDPISSPAPVACPLSERELEVLRGLARGMLYKEIATDLVVSPSTVRNHVHNVYRKLGSRDRAQAVLLASKRGWL
jgi:DNA-binding CsgD family transcriptional regulator/HD-like signal output (HDOD) protein